MKKLKLAGLFIAGLIVGMGLASYRWYTVIGRSYTSREVDAAVQTASQAEWLAELRLGETQEAIKLLESSMDASLSDMGQWEVTDQKAKKTRDRWLVSAKVYHESYPPHGEVNMVSNINSLLATIPGRSPDSRCKSGVCTLDDRRLAKLNSKTNSP